MEEIKECCHKKKERSEKEYKDLIHRLNRIEGQVRGIKKMVESDTYCTDSLVQVSAVNAALNSFNKVLLANHIRTCVANDIRDGKEETIDELVATLLKLMRLEAGYGAIYSDGHELRCMQCPGGEGGFQGAGGNLLFGEPIDEFHGRGRDSRAGRHRGSGGRGWLRRCAEGFRGEGKGRLRDSERRCLRSG